MKTFSLFKAAALAAMLVSGNLAAEPTDSTPVNINTADAQTLATLNGIGASKADAIVAYREANGPFQSADDLDNVKGIGASTVEKNADRITVE